MLDPLRFLDLLEKLLLGKCVLGITEQWAQLWILPASLQQETTGIFVTAAGILVAAAVVILVTASAAVTVQWSNCGSCSFCQLQLGQACLQMGSTSSVSWWWPSTSVCSKVIHTVSKRVCSPESIRADPLPSHWVGFNWAPRPRSTPWLKRSSFP